MTSLPSEVDVAVIGAGSAGIAAARRLVEGGRVSVLVVEAGERAGGRAWTADADGVPMDLGCEWLHSADRNVLAPLADELGFAINTQRPDWTTRLRYSGESEAAEADWLAEHEAFYWAIHRLAQQPEDQACSAALVPGGRWNPLFEAISTWANAAELEVVSAKDHDRYQDSGINWRLHRGYGRLFEALAAGLPIAYGAKATRIDHHGKRLAIETSRGTVRATRVIVAVPSAIIAEERLVFDPPLPDKLAAAAGLPLGLADKLFFHFDGGEEMPERYLIGSTRRRETMSYQVRPFGRPRINCFFGGRFAAGLERDGFDRDGRVRHRRTRRPARQRCATPIAAAESLVLAAGRIRPRLLFLCRARACRRPRQTRGPGRRPAVFRRGGVLPQFLLDRAWRL
jgi:monoamine oxidase